MKNGTAKHVLSFILSCILVIGIAASAAAAGPSIEFKGLAAGFDLEPGSEYTETDLFDDFKNVLPGDKLTEDITFINSASDCDYVDLYMRAKPHDDQTNPVSPNVAAAGENAASINDLLSQLYMKVWNGSELIFDASPDETDGLKQNRYLGTFRTGETAKLKVELDIPLELGNEYAGRTGEVDWVFHVEAFNEDQLTVRKIWSDGNEKHTDDSIEVELLKDGSVERSEVLNAENQWVFTFDKLSENSEWTVREAEVPAGYIASYDTQGNTTTITNTYDPGGDPDKTTLTVEKVWAGDGEEHPDQIEVDLLRDGQKSETVVLNDRNGWAYTWDDLESGYNWTAAESVVPEGYDVSYTAEGTKITITNTRKNEPVIPVSIGVKKVWQDENSSNKRPGFVTAALYNGDSMVDAVYLDSSNNWTYTWNDLSPEGNWQVLEINIPKGYTPSYSFANGVVTITNTAVLIQTGQLNWPIPVLGGLGILLIAFGLIAMIRRRKHRRV